MSGEIADLERQMGELSQKLAKLRKETVPVEVPDYTLQTLTGPVALSSLFGDKDTLFAIHNMGQACRYCTLWADGLNGLLPHLEDKFAVVLLSKDDPELQRRFANSRGWRFRMASHGGGTYFKEQDAVDGGDGNPGIVCYQRQDSKILRRNATGFGPANEFCALWPIISLAGYGGLEEGDWTPQFSYWKRPTPQAMDDGGHDMR